MSLPVSSPPPQPYPTTQSYFQLATPPTTSSPPPSYQPRRDGPLELWLPLPARRSPNLDDQILFGYSRFWVHGASKDTLEASYRTIAETFLLPRRTDTEVNVLALVRDWLQKVDGNPFLMVIDNADNAGIYSGNAPNDEGLASYLLKYDHETQKLIGNGKWIQQVPAMEHDQALQLLQRRLGSDDDESDAKDLIRALDHIPLAISQAAAYIHCRKPRVTLRSYLKEFNGSQKRRKGLLRSDKGDLGRYGGASNSVLLTWQITFDRIRQDHPRAANLLALMSQFQPQNIPESMLHGYDDTSADSHGDQDNARVSVSDNSSEGLEFENDLDVLWGYSLVTVKTGGLCDVHSLVQFCSRSWIVEYGDPARWSRLFLQLAADYFPCGTFETWGLCQSLLPHVEPVLAKIPKQLSDLDCRAELLTNMSWYMLMIGEYSRAEFFGEEAAQTRKDILGFSHSSTLTSMANLASTYRNQGRWEEAERLEVQVMKTFKTKLRADHPDTLTSMNNLAHTWQRMGMVLEATELMRECVRLRQRNLGLNHSHTKASVSTLNDWVS
ncbi:uncharacterized protein F5Z01DRAFT_753511 [Emericellopsis atlantica]|uniref:Uncharacterized protein n=1 Tax=Emericellopsis atlantica TaxID=2614577 RepID=A0A9P7ZFN1_9HYPO|nr:uncharacterized protein F5Z01DRAFT_753511 [Emericellopsis atlantica]KAG9250685.1 hypothetical protein F5Z01DRAFT_753511 [Emericellopsis atlantica]